MNPYHSTKKIDMTSFVIENQHRKSQLYLNIYPPIGKKTKR